MFAFRSAWEGQLDASLIIVALVALALGRADWLAVRQPVGSGGKRGHRLASHAARCGARGARRASRRGAGACRAEGRAGRAREGVRRADGRACAKPRRRSPRNSPKSAASCWARRRSISSSAPTPASTRPARSMRRSSRPCSSRSRPRSSAMRKGWPRSRRSGSTIMPGCARRSSWSARRQGQVRDETAQPGQCAALLAQGARPLGRAEPHATCSSRPGLSALCRFPTEVSVDTDDGRLRPDVIVRLPGGRQADHRRQMLAQRLSRRVRGGRRGRARGLASRAHAASIRNHAQQLGSKAYWAQFGDAADYVVMYIPGEHFLTAALEQDDGLWDWAFERRVLLATPTNLVAIARTVAASGGRKSWPRRPARSPSSARSCIRALRPWRSTWSAVGKNLSTANRRLQPDGRQLRKPGVHPGAPVRNARRRQRQGDCRCRRWSRPRRAR